MTLGHGPDFKARTDLLEREEKARIAAEQGRSAAPEHLPGHIPTPAPLPEKRPGLVTRFFRTFFGL